MRRELMKFCGKSQTCSRGYRSRGLHVAICAWAAGALLATCANAGGADKVQLDRCQEQLSVCYEDCKSKSVAPKLCSEGCTTDQCGLPWRESFGAFLDRRIEESAAPAVTTFIGLKRVKGKGYIN